MFNCSHLRSTLRLRGGVLGAGSSRPEAAARVAVLLEAAAALVGAMELLEAATLGSLSLEKLASNMRILH
jgi:hypothetical protein